VEKRRLGKQDEAHRQRERFAQDQRLVSLDALRGFSMFWIIGGATIFLELAQSTANPFLRSLALQLDHVPWEGFHFFDLIWPLFFFIVGAVMPFSLEKRLIEKDNKASLYLHIVKRSLVLVFLGMVLQGGLLTYHLETFHPFYSVLHGIAMGYFFAAVLLLNLSIRWQIVVTTGLLLLYWALMVLVPVPGFGAGVLTPEGNLAVFIDKALQGGFHYGTNTWFLSYMTFTCSVMIGVFAGHLLKSRMENVRKVWWLLVGGTGCVGLGILWNCWFPIIKLLWTSSFVLLAGGISCILLAFFFLIIDILKYRKWAFGFVVIGSNAIAVYVATTLFDFSLIGNIFVDGLSDRLGHWNGLVQSIAAFAIIWLILLWMYRKNTFAKI